MTMRWNRSMCVPMRVGDGGLDRVGVRDAHDHAAGVLGAQPVDGADDAGLHRGEALAAGKRERARRTLHGAPLGQLHQLLQLGAGPVAEVALEQALVDLHLHAAGRGDRRGGLAGPLERRGVDGVDRLQLGDAFGGPLCLLGARPRPGAGPGRGRAAPCPWWGSARGAPAGRASTRWASCAGGAGFVRAISTSKPTCIRWIRSFACTTTCVTAGAAPAWWRGASRWPSRSGRRIRRRATGGVACPASATRRRGSWCSVWLRPRTAPTAPVGCSPATARATGCSARCTAPGWPTSRRRCRSTTG